MTGIGLAVPRRVGDRVHRDEVDVGVVAAQQVGHRLGVDVGVVHAADHRDLVADPPAGRARVVARRVDDLGDRPAPVQRDEHVAQRVARGVERDGQRELRPERGQAPDPGHDPGRRDRDVPRAQAEPARVVERLDRRQHPVEVEQRLAHAHEHDVRQALAVGREPARGVADLVDDLGDLEVAPEPELAGGAERAADGAAGLARDAQRVPLARRRRGPGSASARDSMRAPSSSRWRAFSVRPPSATRSSVSSTVSSRKSRVERARGAAAGSVRIVGGVGRRRRPSRPRRRSGGRGTPARPAPATHAASSSGVSPERPGRASVVTGRG